VFALDITKVREVLDFTTVTRVPRTPEFMRGVIKRRGGTYDHRLMGAGDMLAKKLVPDIQKTSENELPSNYPRTRCAVGASIKIKEEE
jgi:hypothetical protein